MSDPARQQRLERLLLDCINGKRQCLTLRDRGLFMEAILGQPSPTVALEKLVTSSAGLDILRNCFLQNLSPAGYEKPLSIINFICCDEVYSVDQSFFNQVIEKISVPPTFWNSVVKHFEQDEIPESLLPGVLNLLHAMSSTPTVCTNDLLDQATKMITHRSVLQRMDQPTIANLASRIKNITQMAKKSPGKSVSRNVGAPGGRHDNDFEDITQVAVYPTRGELQSEATPFLLTQDEVFNTPADERAAVHRDNQFRLLREDMIAELREELQGFVDQNEQTSRPAGGKRFRRGRTALSGITWATFEPESGDDTLSLSRSLPGTVIRVHCQYGLEPLLAAHEKKQSRRFLTGNPNFLKYGSCGALLVKGKLKSFVLIDRNEELLMYKPPVVSLGFPDPKSLRDTATALLVSDPADLSIVYVETAIFAFEPVLRQLQNIKSVPLQDIIMRTQPPSTEDRPKRNVDRGLRAISDKLRQYRNPVLPGVGDKRITLNTSQRDAIILGLESPLACIQGPPGTGKSFTGAQLVRILAECEKRILVVTYTNHAVDQFIEDLLHAGFQAKDCVRLGAKGSPTTTDMSLRNLSTTRLSPLIRRSLSTLISQEGRLKHELSQCWDDLPKNSNIDFWAIMGYLEFLDSDHQFYEAFDISSGYDAGEFQTAQSKVPANYAFSCWLNGNFPKKRSFVVNEATRSVWNIPTSERQTLYSDWRLALLRDKLDTLQTVDKSCRQNQQDIQNLNQRKYDDALSKKKILACTTNGAARNLELIASYKPDVLVVEEAGEILESHVLTSLTKSIEKVILIGDHKQLRPKVNNYALSVEKGDGFDLNMSMFERLIRQGLDHVMLGEQHRMHPDISKFARLLTYPELRDAPSTSNRDLIRGIQERVCFVDHRVAESGQKFVGNDGDPASSNSKQNSHEASLVVATVTYLLQQGYSTSDMVVLTPYLGQVKAIRNALGRGFKMLLDERDQADLNRQGIDVGAEEPESDANLKGLRVASVDNYQGEESKIVIISLTRSNGRGEIGFMKSPERLNVLITRARDGFIMIGNSATFLSSAAGSKTWKPFFDLMQEGGHMFNGVPIQCVRHPDQKAVVKTAHEFRNISPAGGCLKQCGHKMPCGLHNCERSCHVITDYCHKSCTATVTATCQRSHERPLRCHQSKDANSLCEVLVTITCERNHKCDVPCGKIPRPCFACEQEIKEAERIVKRNLELEKRAEARKNAYKAELLRLRDELALEKRRQYLMAEEDKLKNAISAAQDELREATENAKAANLLAAQKKRAQAGTATSKTIATVPPGLLNSPAAIEWENLKLTEKAFNKALDKLMGMIGLECIKRRFLDIKSIVDTSITQDVAIEKMRFSCAMLGNPGTGKTTVARLFADFMFSMGVIPGREFVETTGSKLASDGTKACSQMVNDVLDKKGGVIFIDEAYQLTNGNSPGGKSVLDILLAEVENNIGKIIFVVAGYDREMESFFSHNPGLPSRFPVSLKFEDYSDAELLAILQLNLQKKFKGRMDCESGIDGLYPRIAARRVGYGRGKPGFGNARAVENAFERIHDRQAKRLQLAKSKITQTTQTSPPKKGSATDYFWMTKEDLIGPEPKSTLDSCESWGKLKSLIGLDEVKKAVNVLVDSIQENYERELAEQPRVEFSLNKVFLGNPGTGKTTVAKLYGQILADIGLLSNGEVVVKTPADFVGDVMGASESQTKGILAATVGKVLVIDEAYGLNPQGSSDIYRSAVIDTIVGEVHSVPGDDRAVLLLGYQDQMEAMFQNSNPGLSRRFPMSSAFKFEDFSKDDMAKIFDLKLKTSGFTSTPEAKLVALGVLERERSRPNFGNAGEVDILLGKAQQSNFRRIGSGDKPRGCNTFDEIDFDPEFDRRDRTESDIGVLFGDSIAMESVVQKFQHWQEVVRTMGGLGLDVKENIPFNFVFRGPPGTGKTTTARKMGQFFYNLGFLSSDNVIEVSASSIIGQYVGHTGPLVRQVLDKALGQVLFIDEAYRLGEGHFAKEAVDELVDCATKSRYMKKMVIILAGYERDINSLLAVNEGLSSRFPEVIDFRPLKASECVHLLGKQLTKKANELRSNGINIDLTSVTLPSSDTRVFYEDNFNKLIKQAGWANARDVGTLATSIFNKLLLGVQREKPESMVLHRKDVAASISNMAEERKARTEKVKCTSPNILSQQFANPTPQVPNNPALSSRRATNQEAKQDIEAEVDELSALASELTVCEDQVPPVPSSPVPVKKQSRFRAPRDAGVSDSDWEELQRAIEIEEAKDDALESLRTKARTSGRAPDYDKILEALVKAEEEQKKREAERKRVAEMGRCPVGFVWVKLQEGFYKCAGGSHTMTL